MDDSADHAGSEVHSHGLVTITPLPGHAAAGHGTSPGTRPTPRTLRYTTPLGTASSLSSTSSGQPPSLPTVSVPAINWHSRSPASIRSIRELLASSRLAPGAGSPAAESEAGSDVSCSDWLVPEGWQVDELLGLAEALMAGSSSDGAEQLVEQHSPRDLVAHILKLMPKVGSPAGCRAVG